MRLLTILLLISSAAIGQQINPIPDYVFRNQMSVGRNAATDNSAYMSVGPVTSGNKGLMIPRIADTASVTGTKRDGLIIYSNQLRNILIWDSTGGKWSRIVNTNSEQSIWGEKTFVDSVKMTTLSGSGTRFVQADANGVLSAYTPKYAAYSDTTDQDIASANVEQAINFPVLEDSLGIYVNGGDSMVFRYAGVYSITFSAQVAKTDAGTDNFSVWAKKNGANITRSNTEIQLKGNGAKQLVTVNFVLSLAAGDYIQLFMSSPDTDVQLEYTAAQTSPTRPSAPSIIITATQIK